MPLISENGSVYSVALMIICYILSHTLNNFQLIVCDHSKSQLTFQNRPSDRQGIHPTNKTGCQRFAVKNNLRIYTTNPFPPCSFGTPDDFLGGNQKSKIPNPTIVPQCFFSRNKLFTHLEEVFIISEALPLPVFHHQQIAPTPAEHLR